MTLIEAINTGKKFKRKHDKHEPLHCYYYFNKEDILATDWEVEEEKYEITKDELDSLINRALLNDRSSSSRVYVIEGYWEGLLNGVYKP